VNFYHPKKDKTVEAAQM